MPGLGDTNECPRYHMDPAGHSFRRVAHFYQAGHLPVEGGTLDQPTKLMELLEIYDGVT